MFRQPSSPGSSSSSDLCIVLLSLSLRTMSVAWNGNGGPSYVDSMSAAQKSMIAGGIAGSVAKTVTAPLSRLTILYQVSPIIIKSSSAAATSSFSSSSMKAASQSVYAGSLSDACRKIIQQEGALSFWKGNLTSVLHRFPYSAINFTAYEIARDILCHHFDHKANDPETPLIRLVCGGFAGAVACTACYPLDLVRTRLTIANLPPGLIASSGSSNSSSSSSSPGGGATSQARTGSAIYRTLTGILRKEGLAGAYRGLAVSLAVSVPNLAIGFSVYGSLKHYFLDHYSDNTYVVRRRGGDGGGGAKTHTLNFAGLMCCGAVSGVLSSVLTFPADVVRRRMQVIGTQDREGPPPRGIDIMRKIFKNEGVRGMYRGILPELLKVTPMVGVTFMSYEMLMDVLEPRHVAL